MFSFKKEREIIKTKYRTDGVYNRNTRIGTSKDNRTKTVVVSNEETITAYEDLYDISAVASKIVDILPKEATREWIELTNLDKEEKIKFNKELKRLNVKEKIYQAARFSRLYGAGLLFIADGTPLRRLSTPLGKVPTIKNLILFNNFDVESSVEKVIDINDPSFGMPSHYTLRTGTDDFSKLEGFLIHHSRFIIIHGDDVSRKAFRENGYFNYGVLGKLQSVIKDWQSSHDHIPDIISKYNLVVVKIEGMIELLQKGMDEETGDCTTGQKLIQDKMDRISVETSSLSMIAVDKEDEVEIKNPNNISGLKDLLDCASQNLIMNCDIPHTILKGESPIGSNATGNSTTLDWHNKVRIWQNLKLRNPLDVLLGLIAGYLDIAEWDFVFASLWQQTSKEIAETRKINAETDMAYIEDGVLSSEEVRTSRFGGEIYSSDTTIDSDIKSFPKERRLPTSNNSKPVNNTKKGE